MSAEDLGRVTYSFFTDYLSVQKGLRPASIKSYRDTLRLFLQFVSSDARRKITSLSVQDLTFGRVKEFLQYLERDRKNQIQTRNQRLAVLHAFFGYIMFLYNTGARVQEVADLRVGDLDLDASPRVRLHGKGDKWRTCPLWNETTDLLKTLLQQRATKDASEDAVFLSQNGKPLTRFGIYKIVRRHTASISKDRKAAKPRHISPHVFRNTAAVHLLEPGVEVNMIRNWLGHVSLETTNRYAEITTRMKEAALRACEPQNYSSGGYPRKPVWRDDENLLSWLDSL